MGKHRLTSNTPNSPSLQRFCKLLLGKVSFFSVLSSPNTVLYAVLAGLHQACEQQHRPWLLLDFTHPVVSLHAPYALPGASLVLGKNYSVSLAQLGLSRWLTTVANSLPQGIQSLVWQTLVTRLGQMGSLQQDWRTWEHWLIESNSPHKDSLKHLDDGLAVLLTAVITQLAEAMAWQPSQSVKPQHPPFAASIKRLPVPLSVSGLYAGRCTLKLGHLPIALQQAVWELISDWLSATENEALTLMLRLPIPYTQWPTTMQQPLQAIQLAGHQVVLLSTVPKGLSPIADDLDTGPVLWANTPQNSPDTLLITLSQSLSDALQGKAPLATLSQSVTQVSFAIPQNVDSSHTITRDADEEWFLNVSTSSPDIHSPLDTLFAKGLFQQPDGLFSALDAPIAKNASFSTTTTTTHSPVTQQPTTGETDISKREEMPAATESESPTLVVEAEDVAPEIIDIVANPNALTNDIVLLQPELEGNNPTVFNVGDHVHHPVFGEGVVNRVATSDMGQSVLNIQFTTVGKRLLDPIVANISHITLPS
jgi:hypothetical protein